MNRKEYLESNNKTYTYYVKVQQLLKDWKAENNIAETCIVHHRDDTEECIKYNNEHYELWGFEIDANGNLKFELGKYVQFMTNAAHTGYHHTRDKLSPETKAKLRNTKLGPNNPMYQKDFTEEHRKHLSESYAGHRPEVLEKNRESNRKRMLQVGKLWSIYKQNNGPLSYPEFRSNLAKNNIPNMYLVRNTSD